MRRDMRVWHRIKQLAHDTADGRDVNRVRRQPSANHGKRRKAQRTGAPHGLYGGVKMVCTWWWSSCAWSFDAALKRRVSVSSGDGAARGASATPAPRRAATARVREAAALILVGRESRER